MVASRLALVLTVLSPGMLVAQTLPPAFKFSSDGSPVFGSSWVVAETDFAGGPRSELGVLQYSFRIDGPTALEEVPIKVDYYLDADASQRWEGAIPPNVGRVPAAVAFTQIRVKDGNSTYEYASHIGRASVSNTTPSRSGLGYGSFELLLETSHVYTVVLTASGSVSSAGTANYSGWTYAYADPYIYIEPEFLVTHPGYEVRVSPGILNAVTVPEASTVWLSLLGLAFLAGQVRRSRRGQTPVRNGLAAARAPSGAQVAH